MGAREVSLKAASTHLRRTGPWQLGDRSVPLKELLRSLGFRTDASGGGLADALRLFPQMAKLTRGALYVKRA